METERLFYISVLLCLFWICQGTLLWACLQDLKIQPTWKPKCPYSEDKPIFIGNEVHGQDEDPCKGVVCPRGRMCVSSTDSGESYTTCECPEECSSDSEPVCSFYHREFNNRCEMHRYACAHDLTMKVMNRGKCPTENQYACSEQFLLQFPTRYLEWITIAREHSIDPTTSLDFNARADGLTEDERKEILSWEFEYIDRDKNNVLDTAEIQDVFSDVLDFEPCLYGFLKSCDLNEKEGIDKREWDFCFPNTGTAFETRK